MLRTPKSLWISVILLSLFSINAFGYEYDDEYDDYIPEDNARVARIKFLDGEAQIKRVDNENWEVATQNLPLVEGDEITTGEDTRIELQFDKNSYLRLAENSYLKIVNLQDKGIAVSLSQGTMNLTILKYDKDESYFEIDAPQTTIAIQKEGKYRIDAGDENNKEVRVVVSKSGQARVYSNDSGFVLKNGRSARLFLEGTYAGEWETSRSSKYGDDFDNWTAERDANVERNLRNSGYNKYYDDKIYGADDLTDNGSWVYSRDYGYVWKPYRRSTSRYRNWSPYRYGQWRWLPSYGWSWVNDEPWGWATYHYGRWIHTGGYWAWSPYSGYRRTRSYWRPAIVYLTLIGNNYCWYPLPYNYGYYDYNRDYRRRWRRNRRNRRGRRNDTRTTGRIPAANIARARRLRTPPHRRVPRSGVVSIAKDAFGSSRRSTRRPTITVADTVLTRKPIVVDSPPLIPTYGDVTKKDGKDIFVKDNRRIVTKRQVRVGASDRKVGTSLDETLRRKTIYGNRTPRTTNRNSDTKRVGTSIETKSRGTGVFDRTKSRDTSSPDIINSPRSTTTRQSTTTTKRSTTTTKRKETRRTRPQPRRSSPDTIPTPRPQPRRSEPRRTSPTKRTESKRSSPPKRSKPAPAKRSKPTPNKRSKPAPKRESKPSRSKSKSKNNL